MSIYYECKVCCYATNSSLRADDHETETGHGIKEIDFDEDD